VLFSGLLCGVLIYTALTGGYVLVAVGAGLAWKKVVSHLREMAQADPRMRLIYIRHLQYRAFYPARSTPFCRK
jgi:type IV secretion system protein VirB3